jgi:hypothetical protein
MIICGHKLGQVKSLIGGRGTYQEWSVVEVTPQLCDRNIRITINYATSKIRG